MPPEYQQKGAANGNGRPFRLPVTTACEAAVADHMGALGLLLSANTSADARLEPAPIADPDVAAARLVQPKRGF